MMGLVPFILVVLLLLIFIKTTFVLLSLLLCAVVLFFILRKFSKFTSKVDTFDNDQFLESIKKKDIILCGNSPKFPEAFSKVTITPNTFIIRFNTILDHIDPDSKTDVLFVSKELLEKYSIDEFTTWKNKCQQCKIYYIDSLLKNNKVLDEINKVQKLNFTSGFICLSYLCSADVNSITLVGFDLPDDYKTPVNWFRKNVMYTGHDIKSEKEILSELIKKYKINKISVN